MSTRSTQAQSAAPAAPAIAPHIPPQQTVPEPARQAADDHVLPAPADPVAEEEAGGTR
ncbi:hypothetical protein [Streptomyces luteireticuli]|uniref:hypothetical protein n=1 Tax=Streptomyces luteireticuli TaxID=173858 RepID=UPI0035588F0A